MLQKRNRELNINNYIYLFHISLFYKFEDDVIKNCVLDEKHSAVLQHFVEHL